MKSIGRNDSCHCGSGLKYKRCCLEEDSTKAMAESYRLFAEAALEDMDPDDIQIRPFHDFFPEEAETENRALWLLDRKPFEDEPFQLIEFYCVDPKCDCNRVIVAAVDGRAPELGTIVSVGYAFDRNDPDAGPYMDPLNTITKDGYSLYPVIAEMLENDREYVARLKRHYKMVKNKIKSKKGQIPDRSKSRSVDQLSSQ